MPLHPISMGAPSILSVGVVPATCSLEASASSATVDARSTEGKPITSLLCQTPRDCIPQVNVGEARAQIQAERPCLSVLLHHPHWIIAEDPPLCHREAPKVHSATSVFHLNKHITGWLRPSPVLCGASRVAIPIRRLVVDQRPSSGIIRAVAFENLETSKATSDVHRCDDSWRAEVNHQHSRVVICLGKPPMLWVHTSVGGAAKPALLGIR